MQKNENSMSVKETQSRQEQCKEKCAWNLTTQQTKMNPLMSDPETRWIFVQIMRFTNSSYTLKAV